MTAPGGIVYQHVAFDLDGTLIDSRDDLTAAVNHVRVIMGLPPMTPETVEGYVGDGARALVQRALGRERADRFDEGFACFMDYYGAHLLDRTRAHPGIAEALDQLGAHGIALSVLTNKPETLSRTILEGLGLAPRFVAVVGGDSLPSRKPDPAGVEHLRVLTGTARDRMLLVGDSGVDVRTARAAGIAFCGVGWGLWPGALAAAGPVPIIACPGELVPLVLGTVSVAR